ncbi:MBL fold metallo-hydrolase [Thalassospira xiamenensis]|uniref:MBL fold metallo-hydrolase n=1 Tax=Thalassospira xiamenensis TaxID=220697 RepID=UPI003AA970C5
MFDFVEIDFHKIGTFQSGDAITIREVAANRSSIYVIDGGFQNSGDELARAIRQFYGPNPYINYVVATHNDGDHAGGLRTILQQFPVGALWLHRPWLYADFLLQYCSTYTNASRLANRLRAIYPNLSALEEIAEERQIPMFAPFAGENIGSFVVASPTVRHLFRCILQSERSPENQFQDQEGDLFSAILAEVAKLKTKVEGDWGTEVFSPNETSPENDMSVVLYGRMLNEIVLLTGDVGRTGLRNCIHFLRSSYGDHFPKATVFQVPHHGSRRNVNTEILDELLGPRLIFPANPTRFKAYISAAEQDDAHPRLSILRAMYHRGGEPITTKQSTIRVGIGFAPNRDGWLPIRGLPYPLEYEE